ncbi:MAG: hypothetical protein Q9172_003807 [Xanthocarpia lactea]
MAQETPFHESRLPVPVQDNTQVTSPGPATSKPESINLTSDIDSPQTPGEQQSETLKAFQGSHTARLATNLQGRSPDLLPSRILQSFRYRPPTAPHAFSNPIRIVSKWRQTDRTKANRFSHWILAKAAIERALLKPDHVKPLQGGAPIQAGSQKSLECYQAASKLISDILLSLIAKYFDAVDPVYPMIHRETFQSEYNHFWALAYPERAAADGSLVALIFVMLAMGTQFVDLPSLEEKEQTAEFYVSASHQALRMFSYLGRPSMRSIQTMVLITYFLMNDNHASDAWAFAGVLQRQAYALGLNRDPSIVTPNALPFEMQQRRKVWQAVFMQDTFLCVIIKLPPTATHTDVRIEDLVETEDASSMYGASDTSFIRSMWTLASVVQRTICTPRSLDRAICQTSAERTRLVAHFHAIYRSLPLPYRTFNKMAICELARRSRRLARQALFLTSNYYHCLMLIHADENEAMTCDISATLEAAHEAVNSFFLFHTIFDGEAGVWFHFQHRAFSEALIIAELVKKRPPGSDMDPIYLSAKTDIVKMVGILQLSSELDIVARTRVDILRKYL